MNRKKETLMPTKEEIDAVLAYYGEGNEDEAYNKYIKPIEQNHSPKWVEILLVTVLKHILLKGGTYECDFYRKN